MRLPAYLQQCLNFLRPMPSGDGIVIIAGMQKSGTTAIAKLLGAAINESVCSDPFYQLTEMNIDFRKEIYEGDMSLKDFWRKHLNFFSGTIIKDPNFSLLLPQLREMLPDAQLVFIIRDPRDTIRSILNRLNLPGNPEGVDLSVFDIPATWRKILEAPRTQGRDYVEVLAKRWVMCAQACSENEKHCTILRYEDFKSNKSLEIFNLARQLGYSNFCDIDKLVDVQYQPKGNSTLTWVEYFGDETLANIDQVTMPMLRNFEYEAYTKK